MRHCCNEQASEENIFKAENIFKKFLIGLSKIMGIIADLNIKLRNQADRLSQQEILKE